MAEPAHKFEDNERVRIKETGEIVTVDHWWFMKGKMSRNAQYNIKEHPSTWYSEGELESIEDTEKLTARKGVELCTG